MEYNTINLPSEQLPFSQKGKAWRKQHLDWADGKTFFHYSPVRKTVVHKKINYDLVNGILHMDDMAHILNPNKVKASFIPDKILHYPIINSKLNILKGEESDRVFDYTVIVTNPEAISLIQTNKKNLLMLSLQLWVSNTSMDLDEAQAQLLKLGDYYNYEWKDFLEVRANLLLNHYSKEYNMPMLFNNGFMDALTVGEEIYLCSVVGGEPIIERINPLKIRVFKSGYSNRIEDADMIILEDYWSPGKIIDTFGDVLTKKDMKYLNDLPNNVGQSASDSMDNLDERHEYINNNMVSDEVTTTNENFFWDPTMTYDGTSSNLLPYDMSGNVRVLRVYWKSRRRIKKVKSYDPLTGEELFNFFPEDYIIDEDKGEEELIFYINQAWEGTKIGSDIYVNMRPMVIQYNRLSNPSKCNFGIIGSMYNTNDNKPFSFVDMMKPYNYLYDTIHDRLNKLIERSWGLILRFDFSKKPKGWDVDKWLYYAKTMGLAVEDSFNEGNIGAATGKLAGALNNNTSGVIAASDGNMIQLYINLLEYIKTEMSEVVGITKQREGQISNRETVGGVERSTLQSSHITEWVFTIHEDIIKRALECFMDTAKEAIRGRSKKFLYLLPDGSRKIAEIDGDEFAENDYGLVIDNSTSTLELNLKLDALALAALLNLALSFSTIMKLYSSSSLSEKQRMIELNEKQLLEQKLQEQLQLLKAQLEQIQALNEQKLNELDAKDLLNIRDNETKVLIANILAKNNLGNSNNSDDGIIEPKVTDKDKLLELIREFDAKLQLDKDKLEFDKQKQSEDASIKRLSLHKTTVNK